MDLYYLNFNNYYNRQVKRFDTLAGYLPFLLGTSEASRNFNPANDIVVKFVTNRERLEVGDYIVAVNNGVIDSRWFVLNGDRLRGGQYELTVRRDVIADYYSETVTSPCFIEKAKLETGDPMIFNKEDMTVNQIKTRETQLKDRTGCAWVVGYIPNNAFNNSTTVESKYIVPNFNVDYEYNSLSDFPMQRFINDSYFDKPNIIDIDTYIGASPYGYSKSFNLYCDLLAGSTNNSLIDRSWSTSSGLYGDPVGAGEFYSGIINNETNKAIVVNFLTNAHSSYNENISVSPEDFHSYNNKIIKIGSGTSAVYYRISIVKGSPSGLENYLRLNEPNRILQYCNLQGVNGSYDDNTVKVYTQCNSYKITLTQLYAQAKVTIDSNRTHLEDSPYDMFCIPYSDELVIKNSGTNYCVANKSLALSIATAIGQETGSPNLYDIQLLPYCPVQRAIKANGDFDIINESYDTITNDSNDVLGVVIWCDHSNFTFDIDNEITITNPKVQSQCDMYRLVSPNYNGQFEFNVAMNGGMTKFNVDCTYKPFSPYIHINPDFGLLYGSDFNDARGLICGGDFSLPQVSDPWANYQLQNKNYQAIFDRQIQNMETQYKYQNLSQLISGGISAVGTGVTTGVLAGGVFGGMSALASAGGLATDYYFNRQLQNEALDYTKDLFGYNLGNIQALPDSLTKVTAFNANNKIFPILEFYTCTDVERQAFENKIRWNGMTVMRIGTIQEFIKQEETYIKGKMIRIIGVDEPTNVLNEIANEINKGVYIDGRNTTSG